MSKPRFRFRVKGSGFKACRVLVEKFRVWEFRVQGFRISGLRFVRLIGFRV